MLGEVLQVATDMEVMAATATNRFCDNWEREAKSLKLTLNIWALVNRP